MAYPAVLSSIVLVSNILIATGRPNGAYFSVPCPFTNPCEPYNPPQCQQYQQPQSYLVDTKSWSAQGQSYTSPFSVTIKYDSQNDYPSYPNYQSSSSRRSDPMSMDSPSTSFTSPPPYNSRRSEPMSMDSPNASFASPPPYEIPSNEPSAPKRGILTSLFSLPGAVADSMLSGEISL